MDELKFTLIDYLLNRLHFSKIEKRKEPDGDLKLKPVFQCTHHLNGNNAEVLLNVRIEADSLPFIVDVEYKGLFRFNQDTSSIAKDTLEKVIHINCAAQLFPAVRETIAEITRKAGFPPLILPPMNFVSLYNDSIGRKNLISPDTSSTLQYPEE
ncbi:MAG: protein-export chaperone SecB [Spirochaetes bacterium]|nr:protein-export chaperone SecB [Spirochaetota bacterium]